ncbi:MAG TPA: tagatose 1,6-diphosphate aldolase [Dehalococcoidales bacterium]|nr:tagatose 1,6-diphosphate aldolase [Dehalococcoidales bacterium]
MTTLSIGKIRGLQQVANAGGTFTVLAMDHRGSFKQMVNPKNADAVSYQETVDRKMEMCAALSPYASAVLLDPIFGAAQCIQGGALPGGKGLLVSIEESGYEGGKDARVTRLLPNWNVEKIQRMGASAVKILVYFRPELKDLAKSQLKIVAEVAADCQKHDIPLFVEPVGYAIGSEVGNPAEFAKNKEAVVIETAKLMTAMPIDVLKAEFPADMKFNKDTAKLKKLCQELDKASRVPWVLLSAGVDIDTFCTQVEIACEAGASGFLGGRAIWQEVMPMTDAAQRLKFYNSTVAGRFQRLNDIVNAKGKPWYKKYAPSTKNLVETSEDWFQRYK